MEGTGYKEHHRSYSSDLNLKTLYVVKTSKYAALQFVQFNNEPAMTYIHWSPTGPEEPP